MSPENARVFLVEDDKIGVMRTRWFLTENGGHTIVAEASSLEEALNLIPHLEEKGVNVAVVDGNLSPDDSSGRDGTTVAEEIRKEAPNVKIVAYSGEKYDYGDVYVPKPHPYKKEVKLEEIVKEL